MKIDKLYTYPIKSLRATELDSATVTKHGFTYDRRFMILKVLEDGSFKNMAVAGFSEMTLFFTSINIPQDGDALRGTITVTFKPPTGEQKTLEVPLKPKTTELEEFEVVMHHSPTKAYKMDTKYNAWFSACFGFEVVLAYLGDNLRKVLMSTSGNRQQLGSSNSWLSSITSKATSLVSGTDNNDAHVTFADCAPYLIVSDKSMEDVDSRLPAGQQMDITKFRPNIVVSGASEPWEEDFWGELTFNGSSRIVCEHNCGRCVSINIDYATGKPGKSEAGTMLKKLSSDRRVDPGTKYSPCFGRYSFLHPSSEYDELRVGDEVLVSKVNSEGTRFGKTGTFQTRSAATDVLCQTGKGSVPSNNTLSPSLSAMIWPRKIIILPLRA